MPSFTEVLLKFSFQPATSERSMILDPHVSLGSDDIHMAQLRISMFQAEIFPTRLALEEYPPTTPTGKKLGFWNHAKPWEKGKTMEHRGKTHEKPPNLLIDNHCRYMLYFRFRSPIFEQTQLGSGCTTSAQGVLTRL